ncbi:MAG: WbqC family protein, partial [Pelagibacterales bacterium]|nr:WbqC family protein [Pelagibacterales bacterium]
MGNVIIGIHQPNFFPWFGYFLKIAKVNKFIFLDDAQTQKKGGSYLNRTKININGNSKWLTVPIKRKSGQQKINLTQYLNTPWRKNIINTLQMNYGSSPYYKENKEFIFDLI